MESTSPSSAVLRRTPVISRHLITTTTNNNNRSSSLLSPSLCLQISTCEREICLSDLQERLPIIKVMAKAKNLPSSCYQLAGELGRAFAEKVILSDICEAEKAQPYGSLKNILGLLRSMYALVSIEEDASFLRYGYLTPANAAAVRQEFSKLIGELRPHALAIVKSFGIPDSFLTPLAFDWVEANSWAASVQDQM